MSRLLKLNGPFFFVVSLAFLVYLLTVFARSIPALHYITVDALELISRGLLWPYIWYAWEIIGEIGLVIRIAGACFFLAFTIALIRKDTLPWWLIRRGALLEGVYYAFNLPAIIFLLIAASEITAGYWAGIGAAVSFTAQLLIVSPIFLRCIQN